MGILDTIMRLQVMEYIWTFIWLIVLVDIWYTLHHNFVDWEGNPVACYLYNMGGVYLPIIFRVLTVIFSMSLVQYLGRVSPKKAKFSVYVILGIHVLLLGLILWGNIESHE